MGQEKFNLLLNISNSLPIIRLIMRKKKKKKEKIKKKKKRKEIKKKIKKKKIRMRKKRIKQLKERITLYRFWYIIKERTQATITPRIPTTRVRLRSLCCMSYCSPKSLLTILLSFSISFYYITKQPYFQNQF